MSLKLAFRGGPAWLRRSYLAVNSLVKDVDQSNLLVHAGSMAYMTLGSIVPLLALIFAIAAAFQPLAAPHATWFVQFRSFILENLAPRSGQKMIQFLEQFLANLDVAKIGFTGLLTLLLVIVILLRNIELALNKVWHVSQTRSVLKRLLFFVLTIALGALCISVAVSAFSEMHLWNSIKLTQENLHQNGGSALSISVNLMATFVFFSVLQKIGPNCRVSIKAALIGGLVATVMIRLASFGFSIYTANSNWHQNIYEALAVVPLFLVWLYLVWFVVIFSAIVASRVDHGFHDNPELQAFGENILLKDTGIRALLPALCLLEVDKYFLKEMAQEVRGRNLSLELGLPPEWIRVSLLEAEKQGLLLIKRQASNSAVHDQETDLLEALVFPIMPPDRMSVKDFLRKAQWDVSH